MKSTVAGLMPSEICLAHGAPTVNTQKPKGICRAHPVIACPGSRMGMLGLAAVAALPSCAAVSSEGLMLSSSSPALLACTHEGNRLTHLRSPICSMMSCPRSTPSYCLWQSGAHTCVHKARALPILETAFTLQFWTLEEF